MRLREAFAMLALVGALAPAGAGAAPFQLAPDQPETVWLLDAATGALQRCGLAATAGPKVVDVQGGVIYPREPRTLPARPDCALATPPQNGGAGAATTGVVFARGMLGDGSDWLPSGSARGMLGTGDVLEAGDWENQLVVVSPGRVHHD